MRVVVLGGGYAGVVLTDRLERRLPSDVELVVVDESGEHLVQHELHRAIRRPEFVEDITVPLDDIFDRARVHVSTVERIDRSARVVELEADSTLEYDVAAICLGAETAFHGLPGVEEHAVPLKRVEHAATVRAQVEDVLAAGDGTLVVGGAGLSGVQTAGELAALVREAGKSDDIDVLLVEQEDSIVPTFPENFREAVRAELAREGVEVRTGVAIERATEAAVEAESQVVPYDVFVWTGGINGPTALGGNRMDVRADLTVDDRTVSVGDAARVVDTEGQSVPASAQAAVREAKVAARNVATIVEDVRDRDDGFQPRLERYTFDSPGWLVSVGDGAVAQVGPTVFRGTTADVVKSSVGASYLAATGAVHDALGLLRREFDPGS